MKAHTQAPEDNTTSSTGAQKHAIPLLGLELLDLKDAQAAPLIAALADIIEATCVHACAVPTTHAAVA